MDHPEDYEPTEEDLAYVRDKADDLRAAAQKIGLYAQDFQSGTASDKDGNLRMVLFVSFTVGDLAFSDRVLNPEQADINDEFIAMKTQLEDESFEEYRARLAERLKESDDE